MPNKPKSPQVSDRRRKARQRRENVRNRQRDAEFKDDAQAAPRTATITVFRKVLQTGDSKLAMGFLKEIRPKKNIEGQYRMEGLVRHLNIALGINTLLTYHGLIVLLGSAASAKDALRRLAGGPGDIDFRLKAGRAHLVDRTAFKSEEEIARWANSKYARLHAVEPPADPAVRLREEIESETEAVRIVFRAYQRAQLALAALTDSANMNDEDAAARLELAYQHSSTHLNAFEAIQLALFADINPAELWLQYAARFGETFEFARFLGRINAGLEATLRPDFFALTKQILNSRAQDCGLPVLWVRLRELVNRHFSTAKFDLAIHCAEEVRGVIRISRSTRELSVEDPAGLRHVIMNC